MNYLELRNTSYYRIAHRPLVHGLNGLSQILSVIIRSIRVIPAYRQAGVCYFLVS